MTVAARLRRPSIFTRRMLAGSWVTSPGRRYSFQSPTNGDRACNSIHACVRDHRYRRVSIPYKRGQGLQRDGLLLRTVELPDVSIPYKRGQGLQLRPSSTGPRPMVFQSPTNGDRACNHMWECAGVLLLVSIPYKRGQGLQPRVFAEPLPTLKFQSPTNGDRACNRLLAEFGEGS